MRSKASQVVLVVKNLRASEEEEEHAIANEGIHYSIVP